MGEAREFLKVSTAPAHRKLDENPLVAGLMTGSLTIREYQAMLSGYQEFFSAWETAIQREFPSVISELGRFRFEKSHWLSEDLRKLRVEPIITTVDLELPKDRPGLAGCLYVIEGSTLGGMHLSRGKVALPGDASRFFRGYGNQTLPAWADFIEWLEGQIFDETDRKRAAEMANWTFEWFQKKFAAIVHELQIADSGGR
jgi:heme oxygenase